jgi:hypothetical protein
MYSIEILQGYWALEGIRLTACLLLRWSEVYLALIVENILIVEVGHFLLV